MKYLFIFLSMALAPSTALAKASPQAVMAHCKAMSGDYKCALTSISGIGGLMVIDKTAKDPSEESKAKVISLKDDFFEAGGGVFEIHGPGLPSFQSCSRAHTRRGYICDREDEKNSLRKHIK